MYCAWWALVVQTFWGPSAANCHRPPIHHAPRGCGSSEVRAPSRARSCRCRNRPRPCRSQASTSGAGLPCHSAGSGGRSGGRRSSGRRRGPRPPAALRSRHSAPKGWRRGRHTGVAGHAEASRAAPQFPAEGRVGAHPRVRAAQGAPILEYGGEKAPHLGTERFDFSWMRWYWKDASAMGYGRCPGLILWRVTRRSGRRRRQTSC